ncbi:MAG: ClpX C4-type zinc finger protein, partial [Methylobacteriaceae bacterium]|nr:ClpX C4-type zinc finger protein [Methylobacteriaceae bacterium]
DLTFHVGGIDSSDPAGNKDVEWVERTDLRLGDDLRVRLVSAEVADAPSSTTPAVPFARAKGDGRVIQCSFCGLERQTEPEPALTPGIAGPSVFICVRCLVLAERMLDDEAQHLFHLTRTTDQTCSFCGSEHTEESATARQANMCRACVGMVLS